jgi:monoamine oxidase
MHHLATRDGGEFESRHVVCAVPPAQLGALLPTTADSAAFQPSPYKSVYLWLDRAVGREQFWANLWNPGRLNYDFYDLSRIRPGWRGRPSVIASNIIFSHRADTMSDDEIVRATMAEIAEIAPDVARARVVHSDVHHIPMAVACPLVGTESKRPGTATTIPNIFLAGDWTRTGLPCSMEGAVRSGYLAAEAVLAARSHRQPIAVTPRPNDGLARWLGTRHRHAALNRS